MKELKEWYAGLSMSSVQSNYVGNSRRQKRPTNLLQTFILLAMMLIVGGGVSAKTLNATFGDPATNGSWNGETNTYSWTNNSSNLMPIFTFDNGQLANYTKLHLTTSNYSNGQAYRVCFMNGSTAIATIAFYSAGEKNLVFAERSETKDIDLSQITSIQFGGNQDSNSGSIGLDPTSVYLEGPDPSYTVSITRTNIPTGCDAWFTLGSDPTKYTTSKADVPVGTLVHFYASADGNDNKDVNGWRKTGTSWHDGSDPGWIGFVRDFTTTIRETATGTSGEAWLEGNIDLTPEFKDAYTLRLTVGEGGTAVMYESGDVNKVSLNGRKYTAASPSLTFEAQPNPGYSFVGWFENGSGTAANSELTWNKGPYSASPMASLTVEARFAKNANHTVTLSTPKPFGQVPLPENLLTAKIKNTETVVNSGDKVPDGTIITFTALNFSNNAKYEKVDFPTIEAGRMVLTGWKLNDGDEFNTNIATSGIVWYGSTTSYDVTVNSDIDFQAIYYLSYVCKMQEATGGTAVAKIGDTTLGSGSAFRGNSVIQLTATPDDGYVFDHWDAKLNGSAGTAVWSNDNWSTANPYNFTVNGETFNHKDGMDIIITPVFKSALKTIGKPECNHYGDRTHGENYFDINKLNVAEGVTIAKASPGQTVTVPTTGGYMSFAFENEYNFGDLVRWTISENKDLIARVNNVEFRDADGNELANCYTDAGDRPNVGLDVQGKLKKVKEIRIHFKESTDEHQYAEAISYTFEWIRFVFEHADRTLPTLTEGTAAEMEIYETTSLSLSNTPGYWRQYTDDTYGTVKTDGLIPTNEWKSSYKLGDMQIGNYYFGARDGGSCALGYNHQTDLVPVHVNVKAFDIIGDIVTTQNSSDKDGEHVKVEGDVISIPYVKTIGEANVTLNVNNTRNSFDTCDGVKLNKDWGTELIVNAPNGFRVQKVDITFGESFKYNLSMNRGDDTLIGEGDAITYTNHSEYDYVRMVVREQAKEDEKEVHVTNVKVYLVPVNAKVIDESRDITVEGQERKYWLYVPEHVKDLTNKNVPVVFALHGGGEDYEPTHSGQLNFNSLADANNFIVVYPRAAEHLFPHFNSERARAWEATGAENDDTKLFLAIIDELEKEGKKAEGSQFSIDSKKIYMAGFSVGGMMSYATANVLADKFAAFASIAGLPMNEVHMRTHNARPVPFLHVHGTKDDFVRFEHMPTIVDNMLNRNGLSYSPTVTLEGDADIWSESGKTRYKKYAYGDEQAGATTKSGAPYIYYQIGTGMTASDTGMGHNHWCNIGGKDVKQVMWEFFKGRSVPDPISNPFEFKADINTANNNARQHGWLTNTSSGILAQYGESGGYSRTNQNVYHSIQLNPSKHYISFDITGESEHYVRVRVARLADITGFNTLKEDPAKEQTVDINEKVFLDNVAYKVGSGHISIMFDTSAEPTGEYIISITKGGQYDNTTISNITIASTGTETGTKYTGAINTDFNGYFNYNNRLFAQWNFDLSDGFRTNVLKLAAHPDIWIADYSNTNKGDNTATYGTIVFKNKSAISDTSSSDTDINNYDELTYDGTEPLAVSAGLKFKAQAEGVKILVDLANGQVSGAHLELAKGVKMYVPYVKNSYRNDTNDGTVLDEKKKPSEQQDLFDKYKNCMHHINRDIVYIALQDGNAWDHITNKCLDAPEQYLFRNGGDEFVNGKTYNKADYMGIQDTPCFIEFSKTTTIDRIGVNRNLTYSFYTEYINELAMTKPSVHQRIVGSPTGAKVANIGEYTTYENAVAFTYGGWQNNEGGHSYKSYDNVDVNDDWSQLGVYSTNGFCTWNDMPTPEATSVIPVAIDGFPVATKSSVPATSEKLMPSNTTGNIYHPADQGKLSITSYAPNVTPWTLPCRGAYGKFEVSFPGVLNANVIMKGSGATTDYKYYIADEFGKPIPEVKIRKTATGVSNEVAYDEVGKFYTVPTTDYVKFSFNVYPGKTYYIFSNDAGLGLSGFYYEPFVYRPEDGGEDDREYVGYREIVLNDNVAFSIPTNGTDGHPLVGSETIQSPKESGNKDYTIHYSKDAVKVTLNRSFNKDTWNSICLPYSINQAQMENVFGVGTEVILLRDIRKAGTEGYTNSTLNFITHANQDIIAGYPYLIKPTKAVSNVVTYACLSDGQVATAPMNDITSTGNFTGDQKDWCMPGFTFTGTFDPIAIEDAPISVGSFYMAGGYLYQATEAYGIKGYRAWLKYSGDLDTAKAIQQALVDDIEEIEIEHVTGIEEVKTDTTATTKSSNAIYNINGQMVGSKTSDFRNLPKGIYIINGRKHIVK